MTQPIALVTEIEPRSQFTADGVQVAFPCAWPLRTGDDLQILFGEGDIPEIVYSITGLNDDAGFTVTFQTPPPASIGRITIFRDGLIQRTANYSQQRRFAAETVDADFIDVYLRLLELQAQMRRMLRLPDSDPPLNTILPPATERANKFAGFNSIGQLIALASPGSIVLDFNQYPTGVPAIVDSFIYNDADDTTGSPIRKATLQALADLITSAQELPFRTRADAEMTGDGTTDDSFRLQADMDEFSANFGGATFWLKTPTAGSSFYFAHSPRVPSNITLIFASPVLLAKDATLYVRGRRSAVASKDSFRLLEGITAGANVARVDTAPHGGGALSTHFAIGDYAELVGVLDGCGTPATEQECRVTGVADGPAELTFQDTIGADYSVSYASGAYEENYGLTNYAIVRKLVVALATVDLSENDNLVTIRTADIGKLTAGDTVIVKDDLLNTDLAGVAGATSVPINEELAMIVPSVSGDPSASVRLDRRASRNFTAARNLRLVKLNVVTNSVISGARMLSGEAPDVAPAAKVHWMEQRYARGCIFDGCTVPNTDVFGKRGTAFNFSRCLDPVAINLEAAGAKYIDDGEGNGIVFDRCTGGKVQGGHFDGMRHSTQAVCGNSHAFHDVTIVNPRHAPVDCHGTGEVDVNWYDCTIVGGTRYEVGEGRSPPVVVFGNPSFLAGPTRAGFHGGSISGFDSDISSLEPVVYCHPGARNCTVDTKVSGIRQAFRHSDVTGFGTVISSGHRIRMQVDGCDFTRVVDVHGRREGASVDTLVDTRIEIYARRINGGIFAVQCTELEIVNCDFDEVTIDPSATYFLEAENCTALQVRDNRTCGMGRFVRLTDCTDYSIVGNRMLNQDETTVLHDIGGNFGNWTDNRAVGFIPFWTHHSTSSIVVDGRLPGQFDLLDDTVIKIIPLQKKGLAQFFSTSGTSFFANVQYDVVTPQLNLGEFCTANVESSTSDLAGATGTDAKLTISAFTTDDEIQVENRLGGTIRVTGRVE